MPAKKRRHVVIHSDDSDDIDKAKVSKVWASTIKGNKILREYFDDSIVYLYFTKFRSGKFCGVARMKTRPSKPAKRGYWAKDSYGKTFDLDWINDYKSVPIPHPYCGNVLDADEIDEATGKKILVSFVDKTVAKDEELMRYLKVNPITRYFSSPKG